MTNNDGSKQFYIATANLLNFANPNRIYYENAPAYDNKAYEHKRRGLTDLLAKAHADIIAVDGDPISNIRELENVTFVMKGGKVVEL